MSCLPVTDALLERKAATGHLKSTIFVLVIVLVIVLWSAGIETVHKQIACDIIMAFTVCTRRDHLPPLDYYSVFVEGL